MEAKIVELREKIQARDRADQAVVDALPKLVKRPARLSRRWP